MVRHIIRCTELTRELLDRRKDLTGRSIPELVEHAVVNMPFIAPKRLRKNE